MQGTLRRGFWWKKGAAAVVSGFSTSRLDNQ